MKGGQHEHGRLTHTRLGLAHDVNTQDGLRSLTNNEQDKRARGREERERTRASRFVVTKSFVLHNEVVRVNTSAMIGHALLYGIVRH